ncbi:MAG: autotransporter-associated beta strand repeat-containing protein, partial [Pirellulales bacterium]|nr:autotransporter-associated beta strand repeat-containing protein [Pirellulales bacterium]
MSQLVKISILALIVGLELALPAQAQVNYYWDLDPLSSGDYTTLSNWDPDYPATPTTNDFMHVNNGGTCLITSALMNLPSYIYAGRNEGTSGTITQSAGIVTIDGGLRVGYTGGTGTYNMTGGTLTCSAVPTDYGLFVGSRAGGASFGDGTINMSGGAQATIGKQARIGEAGGTGRLYMSGASTMSIAELGYIGLDGGATGIVDLSGTASISIGTDAYIGANASSQGTIGLAGDSTLNVGGNAFIGIGAGGTGTINMNDLTVANTSDANFNGGSVNFGYAGALGNIATGVLNMDGSTTFNSKVIGLGVWNHSRGVLNLAGNAQLYATERISAGDNWGAGAADAAAGRGEIHLSGNATLTTPSVRLGTFGYGDGYMTVSSTAGNTATANVAGWFGIGIYGGNGELVMDDNGLVNHTADNVTVGDGTGNLSDGTPKPSVGVVTMNGGTFNNSSSNSLIGIGINGGTGTWTQNDGTLLSPTGYVLLGSGGGTATMNLNGGVIEVPRIQSSGSPASTTLNFNGGTLRAAADGVLITDNDATPVLNVVVQSGGAVVDTNGKDASITRPLLDGGGGGGLTKQGAGALTLTKANTYMGTTAVSAGDLLVSSTGSLATTGVSLTSGTRLALPSTTAVTVPLASLSLANASTIDLPLTTTAAGANAVTTAALTIPTGGTANLRVGSQGASLQVGTPYTVINGYSGLPAGTIAAQSLIRGYTALANVTPSAVTVTLSGSAAPMSVTWSGNVDNKWDVVGTANWNAGMDQFYELDNVTFDSSGSAQPNVYVAERVHANKIDVNDGGVNYTLSGPGEVIVQTTLDKRGSGTYTFDNTGGVSVGGAVIVGGGTLSFGANSGDTTLPGAVSMVNYSTLDVSGGASLTLNGVVSDDGYTGLHKTGTGTLVLSNATNNYSGSSNFAGGTVVVPNLANGGATSSIGASSADPSNLRLAGATLQYTGPNVTIDRGFGLDGDGTFIMDNNLTMTGGVKSTAGLLYKRGAGTLELISPPDDLGLPYVNQIGDYLVVYGGGVILDGVATT